MSRNLPVEDALLEARGQWGENPDSFEPIKRLRMYPGFSAQSLPPGKRLRFGGTGTAPLYICRFVPSHQSEALVEEAESSIRGMHDLERVETRNKPRISYLTSAIGRKIINNIPDEDDDKLSVGEYNRRAERGIERIDGSGEPVDVELGKTAIVYAADLKDKDVVHCHIGPGLANQSRRRVIE